MIIMFGSIVVLYHLIMLEYFYMAEKILQVMDMYGYQYEQFTKLLLESNLKFADHILALSSSRYVDKDLLDEYNLTLPSFTRLKSPAVSEI